MKQVAVSVLGLSLGLLTCAAASAHQSAASEPSAISALPVAVSVAASTVVLAGGLVLSVVAVEASAEGSVWILKRASDGVQISVRFAGRVVSGIALSAGTAITVSVTSAGYVLSAASEAIAFIPNELGARLLYNERVTR